MNIGFPLRTDRLGRLATVNDDDHIRELIEQVLFTTPGERVNRPTFGSGLLQLVFAPMSDEIAATLQFVVQSALTQWLGDRIELRGVAVRQQEGVLEITVSYVVRRTQEAQSATFSREVPS